MPPRPRRSLRRRALVGGVTMLGAAAVGGWATTAVQRRIAEPHPLPRPTAWPLLDDASRLNPTPIKGVVFGAESPEATATRFTPLLQRIAAGQEPALAVSGTRHSMGGQSLLRDGWVLDSLPMNAVAVDADGKTMRVGAGTTWQQVIAALNARGLAPAVMQSNNDFTVGGSISVNCHGWQTNSPPIATTVRRLRVLAADGTIVSCDASENAELFGLVLGGYGLFGVLLEAELAVVPNVVYEPAFTALPTREYAATFADLVYARASVEMAYGRLRVDPDQFLEQAIIGTYVPQPDSKGRVLPLPEMAVDGVARTIFRGSAGSGSGKARRWWLEREVGPWLAKPISRNVLLNEPAALFGNRTAETTDILHEYFVPQARLWDFVAQVKTIVPREEGDLLNVTVRDVRRDSRSTLAYARDDMFGLVMLFVQERTVVAEERMQRMTRSLIDAVLDVGGTFYLPYRPHATAAQLRRAYPAWDAAMAAKRRLDPAGVFQNELYRRYGNA
ncbi:FAD-binding oxidoreductase [Reyranella sp. CPCC 100927]|nr:FAD-binding oxidoreductase [Reyranella sp. CPCC 100927]